MGPIWPIAARPPTFKWPYLGHFLSDLDKLGDQNDQLIEADLLVQRKTRLDLSIKFCILVPLWPMGATGATLGVRVPNQVQKLGFGLTYHPQPVTPNLMFPKNHYHTTLKKKGKKV